MFEKSCRCGATKKNFKIDIGEFFIDECCTKAGYDHMGKKAVDLEDLGLDKDKLDQQLNSDDTQKLEIQDEGEQPDPNEETQPEESTEQESEESSEEEKALEAELDADREKIEAEDNTPIQAPAALTVTEEGHIVPVEETKQESKPKRQYNRNGKIKKQP